MLNKVTETIWCHDPAEIQEIRSTMDAGYKKPVFQHLRT